MGTAFNDTYSIWHIYPHDHIPHFSLITTTMDDAAGLGFGARDVPGIGYGKKTVPLDLTTAMTRSRPSNCPAGASPLRTQHE